MYTQTIFEDRSLDSSGKFAQCFLFISHLIISFELLEDDKGLILFYSSLSLLYFQGRDYRTQFQMGSGALLGASYIQVKHLVNSYAVKVS